MTLDVVTGITIVSAFLQRAEETPESVAYCQQHVPGGEWIPVKWREQQANVLALAHSLIQLGIRKAERVGIVSPNHIEWETAQMAVLLCGAVVVGIDPHSPDELLIDLVRRGGVTCLFIEDERMLSRLPVEATASLRWICALRRPSTSEKRDVVHRLESLILGAKAELPSALSLPQPADSALVIFSSGTTGTPKPIIYTHGQVMLAAGEIMAAFPDVGKDSNSLCWLPLANLFQRMINFCAICVGATTYVLSDPREVMTAIPQVNPRILIGVPRFFERVRAGVIQRVERSRWPVSIVAKWAFRVANLSAHAVEAERRRAQSGWRWQLADRLVLRRIRGAFGTRLMYLISGSAPMPPMLHKFFDGIGLPVYEAYGISENIIPIALNKPGHRRVGSVGKPALSNKVRVSSENEIEIAGPGVFTGYLDDSTSTLRPDAEGYWRTGDLGRFDTDGYLYIEGRKSDWFKLSTGRWITPLPIEQRLSTISYVESAVVFGAGRKAVAALIVSTAAIAPDDSSSNTRLFDAKRIAADIQHATSDMSSYQQPAIAVVLREPLSIANSEITTNLKPRRKKIEERYLSALDEAYAELEKRGNDAPGVLVKFL